MQQNQKGNFVNIIVILLFLTAILIMGQLALNDKNNNDENTSNFLNFDFELNKNNKERKSIEIEKIDRLENRVQLLENELDEIKRKLEINSQSQRYINIEEPAVRNINQNMPASVKQVIYNLSSIDKNTRKAEFNKILKIYQQAFCNIDLKNVPLPNNLFEKLSENIADSGPGTTSITEFINSNYAGISDMEKMAINETLEGMNELSGSIRGWDISKTVISYGILKAGGITFTKENLQKAQQCINGKTTFSDVEEAFYRSFGISKNITHEILTSLCDDWIGGQTEFAKKFLRTDTVW